MMPIQINAPEVEQRLQKEAARRGVTAADYALEILHRHLPANGDLPKSYAAETSKAEISSSEAPVCESLTGESPIKARKSQFHRWVESHNSFPKLLPEAFERASFYEGQEA